MGMVGILNITLKNSFVGGNKFRKIICTKLFGNFGAICYDGDKSERERERVEMMPNWEMV